MINNKDNNNDEIDNCENNVNSEDNKIEIK